MDKVNRIKELVGILNKASYAYYAKDDPIMSDKQYDDLFDELAQLENETGIVLSGSPTQKVQGCVVPYLNEVQHTKTMLSADKTKDIQKVIKFIGDRKCVVSWKEDGLTIVLRYEKGEFVKAITRGGGITGEDVTHTMRMCKNIPLNLPYRVNLEVRGECVMSWEEFDRINEGLEKPYKHPRNLAAGSVRQLDANILKNRRVIFKAFELVQDDLYIRSEMDTFLREQLMDISESFDYLEECGFDVVEHEYVTADNLDQIIEKYIPDKYGFPVDGLIFEYDDYIYGKELGETAHHPLNMIALKWADDLYETTLENIEWNTTKTGTINPVAVFAPVDLDGAVTTRATLHNISYIENLKLGLGDTIQVYRSNMVIPKVHDNLTRSNAWELPEKCPCCGGDVEIHNENGSKTLHCKNPDCKAKLLSKLTHAVSKNALNIDGLSEATIEKFINSGWLSSVRDIYHLKDFAGAMEKMEGFGKKSATKLLEKIERSRSTTLDRLIYSLSIPLIGRTASKDIAKRCNYDVDQFRMTIDLEAENAFMEIEGFGEAMNQSLINWWSDNRFEFCELVKELTIENPTNISDGTVLKNLAGMTFVITGSMNIFANRDEAKNEIEKRGGKVSGSVSSKTTYLVNNDINSNSKKNMLAKAHNIPIISEEMLLSLLQ